MTGRQDVLRALNEIVDPCSVRTGAPAGLVDMGLVGDIDIRPTSPGRCVVAVQIGVTEPGCFMIGPFAVEARERLRRLPDVDDVEVGFRTSTGWTEDDMTSEYRLRLAAVRSGARVHHHGHDRGLR